MLIERLTKCAGFLFAAAILFDISPAYAGFQWIAPAPEAPVAPAPQLAPAAPAPAMQLAPAASPLTIDTTSQTVQPVAEATKNPEVITPIIIDGGPSPMPSAQNTAAPEILSQAPVSASIETPAAPPVMAPVTAPLPTLAMSQDIVQGFANQVPLTVALREILPPGYGFSIDQDVDMGVLVSFQGGKPWRETLANALDPVGLMMHEQAQMISIGRIPSAPALPAPVAQNAPVNAPMNAPVVAPASMTAPATTAPTAAIISAPAPISAAASASSAMPPVTAAVQMPAAAAPVPPPVIISAPSPTTAAGISNPPAPSVTLAMTPSTPIKPASAAEVPVAMVQVWSAERGDSLRKVLQDWSHRVHSEVEWLSEYDYPLQASINYSGTYEEAVRNLLMGFEGAHPEPVAQLHINPELGQTVLVVRTRGNTSRD